MPTSRVVVITGASSGIGRAAAHAFAREGAQLVLAARSETSLDEVVAECAGLGATAIAVPTDVSVEEQVGRLVDAAVERFGRVDVWVGAASVYIYGSVEQTPARAFERILAVNVLGQIHGVRAVLPQLKSGSVIILRDPSTPLSRRPTSRLTWRASTRFSVSRRRCVRRCDRGACG